MTETYEKWYSSKNSDIKPEEELPHGLLVGNPMIGSDPLICPMSSEAVKDFFKKELNHFRRARLNVSKNTHGGFFYESGLEGIEKRKPFNKFFEYSNVIKMTKQVENIFDRHMEKLVTQHRATHKSEEFMKVEFKEVLNCIFDDLVNNILFGVNERSQIPFVDGLVFTRFVHNFMMQIMKCVANPLHICTNYLLHRTGLVKSSKILSSMRTKLKKTIHNLVDERMSEPHGSFIRDINLIDLLIESNEQAKSTNNQTLIMTKEDIFQNVMTLYVAGGDTSKATSSVLVHQLGHSLELQARARQAVARLQPFGPGSEYPAECINYESDSYMNAFFTETFRILGPTNSLFIRECIKPCRINGVKIKKGAKINISFGGLHRSSKLFEKPMEFLPDRFEHDGEKDENCDVKTIPQEKLQNMKRNAEFAPFSYGRRACIGAFFGEIVVKIMLRSLIRRFEWKAASNTDRKVAIFSTEMETVNIEMRPLPQEQAF